MRRIVIIYIIFLFFSPPGFTQHGASIPSQESPVEFKSPNAYWQSLASGIVYSASFFLLDGNSILHNFDSLWQKTENGVGATLAVSSIFSACAVAIVGDLTATRNGGSYLSTLTIDWIASLFAGMAANAIYTGKNPSIRFIVTLVPSVGILVLMNQMYFDPTEKSTHFREGSSLLENFVPLVGPKFVGMNFHKSF